MRYKNHKSTNYFRIKTTVNTGDGTLPDAVVILRDQAEERPLCQMNYIAAQMNIPEWSLKQE